MTIIFFRKINFILFVALAFSFGLSPLTWESKFIKQNKDGSLTYIPDEDGNIIPDFSRVGFYGGDKPIPDVAVVKTVSPTGAENDGQIIQAAIDEVSKRPLDKNGFRGAILLKKGTYKIPGTIRIEASGIVLRGEGDGANGTKLVTTTKKQGTLINVAGRGDIAEVKGSRVKMTGVVIPAGAFSINVTDASNFKKGDKIILFRPGTQKWIEDLQMDRIEAREGTKQWQPKEYDFLFERVITKIEGKEIFMDNPVVMPMEILYGGAEIYKYEFHGRINHVGIEKLYLESEFETDTSENHGWDAIAYNKIEQGWVRNVTARYFGYSCVNLGDHANPRSISACQV